MCYNLYYVCVCMVPGGDGGGGLYSSHYTVKFKSACNYSYFKCLCCLSFFCCLFMICILGSWFRIQLHIIQNNASNLGRCSVFQI